MIDPIPPQLTSSRGRFLRALIVEDNEGDAELCVRSLKIEGFEVISDLIQTREEFVERLSSNTYDIILADYGLPGWTGMNALTMLHQLGKDIPFILISGTVGEDIAVECIKKGASDYVLKERLIRLPLVVHRALEERALREQRRRSEAELRASEERYRELFENANDIVYSLDLSGLVTSFNKAGERITGYTREEVLNRGLSELLEPEAVDRMADMMNRKLAGAPVTTYEIQLVAKDGRRLVLEINSRLVYKEGIAFGVQGIARDVTERKQAEEQIRRNEAQIRAVLETAMDCIITIDHQGLITEFNPAAEKTFGYSRAEVLGKSLVETIIPSSMRESFVAGIARYLETGEGQILFKHYETTGLRADGTEFPIELSITPHSAEGRPHFTAYLRDITERLRAATEREKLIHDLQEALTKVKTLSGLLPICAWCKKVRDDQGYWSQIEVYIEQHSEAEFTHGVCPECAKRIYPELQQTRRD